MGKCQTFYFEKFSEGGREKRSVKVRKTKVTLMRMMIRFSKTTAKKKERGLENEDNDSVLANN